MSNGKWDAYVIDGRVIEIVPAGQPPTTMAAATADCHILPAVYASKHPEHVFKAGGEATYTIKNGAVTITRETEHAPIALRLATARNRLKAMRDRVTEAAALGDTLTAREADEFRALKDAVASLEKGELVELPEQAGARAE